MNYTNCPICYEELEVRKTTPCMDCGTYDSEIEDLKQGKNSYAELSVIYGSNLVLCHFCQVDFGSYKSETWEFPDKKRIGYEHMNFLRDIKPEITKTKFCPNCGQSLSFLKFMFEVREKNKG